MSRAAVMMTAYVLEDLEAEASQERVYEVLYEPLGIERTILLQKLQGLLPSSMRDRSDCTRSVNKDS